VCEYRSGKVAGMNREKNGKTKCEKNCVRMTSHYKFHLQSVEFRRPVHFSGSCVFQVHVQQFCLTDYSLTLITVWGFSYASSIFCCNLSRLAIVIFKLDRHHYDKRTNTGSPICVYIVACTLSKRAYKHIGQGVICRCNVWTTFWKRKRITEEIEASTQLS
jgi:hypothetical protein